MRFGVRDYDPQIGRWGARDPALYQGMQANLYVYAGNNPINRTDSLGLFSVGFSSFAGAGGSISIAIDSSGASISVGAGVGAGAGFSFDTGATHQESGVKTVAEASVTDGFFGLDAQASIDLNGCNPQASVSGSAGPVQASASYNADTHEASTDVHAGASYSSGGVGASSSLQVVGTIGISW